MIWYSELVHQMLSTVHIFIPSVSFVSRSSLASIDLSTVQQSHCSVPVTMEKREKGRFATDSSHSQGGGGVNNQWAGQIDRNFVKMAEQNGNNWIALSTIDTMTITPSIIINPPSGQKYIDSKSGKKEATTVKQL